MRSLALVPYARRHRAHRRAARRCATTCSSARADFPGVDVEQDLPAPLPAAASWPPSSSARSARSAPRSSSRALPRRRAGHGRRQGGPGAHLRPLPARRSTASTRIRSTRSGGRRASAPRDEPRARAPAAHCRSTSTCSRRRGGAAAARSTRRPGRRRRLRGARPAQRRGAGHGLLPDASTRACSRGRSRRQRYDALFGEEAGSPRFNRAIAAATRRARPSSRSPRSPALAEGLHHARHADQRHRLRADRRRRSAATPATRPTGTIALRARAAGLVRRLLLHARARPQPARGPAAPELGAAPGLRPPHGHRPAQRVRGHRSPTARGATSATALEAACRARGGRAAAGSPTARTARGRWATTSTSRSARATCRPRRCRWRSPTRRSPTADGRAPAPRARRRGRRRAHAAARSSAPPVTARQDRRRPTRQAILDGLHLLDRRRRHLGRRVRRLEPRRVPDLRQDRHRRARRDQGDQSWYVAYVPARAAGRSSIAATVEQGGFGAEAAAPAVLLHARAVVRPEEDSCTARRRGTPSERAVTIQLRDVERAAAGREPASRSAARCRFDPRARARRRSGCAICSLVTIAAATGDDVAGDPSYYVAAPGDRTSASARSSPCCCRASTTRACASSSTASTAC